LKRGGMENKSKPVGGARPENRQWGWVRVPGRPPPDPPPQTALETMKKRACDEAFGPGTKRWLCDVALGRGSRRGPWPQQQLFVRMPPRFANPCARRRPSSGTRGAESLGVSPARWSGLFLGWQPAASLKPADPLPACPGPKSTPVACCPAQASGSMARWVWNLNRRDSPRARPAVAAWAAGSPPPPASAWCGGTGEQGYRCAQHDGAWTPLNPVLAVDPGARTHGRRWRPWPLSAAIWRPITRSGGCRSARKNLVALPGSLQPVGAGTLQPSAGRPLPLFAQLQQPNRPGRLLGAGPAPRSPATNQLVLLGTRRRPPPISKIESSGRALFPQAGELIVPEQEGLALRTLRPADPAAGAARQPRSQQFSCPVAGRALLGCATARFPAFNWKLVNPNAGAPARFWLAAKAAG